MLQRLKNYIDFKSFWTNIMLEFMDYKIFVIQNITIQKYSWIKIINPNWLRYLNTYYCQSCLHYFLKRLERYMTHKRYHNKCFLLELPTEKLWKQIVRVWKDQSANTELQRLNYYKWRNNSKIKYVTKKRISQQQQNPNIMFASRRNWKAKRDTCWSLLIYQVSMLS